MENLKVLLNSLRTEVQIAEGRLYKTPEPQWTEDDKTKVWHDLALTRYEHYWLMWRLRVHLRSYEQVEWSEMKDVLTKILTRLEKEWAP